MSESATPPPPASPPGLSLPAIGCWWLVWVVTSMLTPFITLWTLPFLIGKERPFGYDMGLQVAGGIGVAAITLHAMACVKLRAESTCLFFFLLVGGWVFMATSLFAACLHVMRSH